MFGEMLLQKNKTALLCVDLQKCYYTHPTTQHFPNLEKVVSCLLAHFRAAKAPIVHVMQEDLPHLSPWMSWWDHLHPEEGGSSLGVPIPLDCARALAGEPVLIKNGFDGFHATKLHEILHQQGVDTVIIFGLITRACVLNTLMSAFNHGYRILLVEDACADRDPLVHKQIMDTYNGYNCVVLTSEDLMKIQFELS